MKRKLLSLVLGTAMIMATGVTAMAAEVPDSVMTAPVEAAVAVEAVEANVGDYKEGLSVSHFPEFDENALVDEQDCVGHFGIISKEDMKKIASALNLSEDESNKLMVDFNKNMELQDKLNGLYANMSFDLSKEEMSKINEEINKLHEKMVNVFTGDILDKAIELGLLNEVHISVSPAMAVELDEANIKESMEELDINVTDKSSTYYITSINDGIAAK